MKTRPFILVADRSAHIRGLLKRELIAEGYGVRVAENPADIFKWIFHRSPLNLMIMDVDFPDIHPYDLMRKIINRIPVLPVVIHGFYSEEIQPFLDIDHVYFVEKDASSAQRLTRLVRALLNKTSTE